MELDTTTERRLARGLQFILAAIAAYGVFNFNAGIVAPAAISLGITFVPALLRREYEYSMHPWLVLWITLAVFLHTVGTLGLYRPFQWYDEITHTVSASLIAGIGYAVFRALEIHTDDVDVPDAFRGLFIVVFVLAAGMVWEVMEFALGEYIPVYGVDDIVTDMIANLVGAVIVALVGAGPVDGLVRFVGERLRSVGS